MPDLEECRCEGGVPIMGVDNIWLEVDILAELQPGTSEEAIPAWIVKIIVKGGIVVKPVTSEIFIGF